MALLTTVDTHTAHSPVLDQNAVLHAHGQSSAVLRHNYAKDASTGSDVGPVPVASMLNEADAAILPKDGKRRIVRNGGERVKRSHGSQVAQLAREEGYDR